MIYNRYAGIRRFFRRGSVLRNAYYILNKPRLKHKARKYNETGKLFSQVEIETVNRCNGECAFCPVNRHEDSRPFAKMTEGLFQKIIGELSDLGYDGTLSLYSNNEPFLDRRIGRFARYAKEKCPHAMLQLYTNGTVLTEEKLEETAPYLDKLVLDNYNDGLILNEQSVMAKETYEKHGWKGLEIHLRKQNEVLYTRGGSGSK